MNVKDFQDGKLFVFSKPFDTRLKILNGFYFLSFFGAAIFFFLIPFAESYYPLSAIAFSIFASLVCLIASYRFINKAFMSEQLFTNKNQLQLIKTGFLTKKKKSYDTTKISRLRNLNKPQLTRHPLAGDSFDYLGFQTEQQVINEMHGDNRLAFDYEGRTISFGQNIYSWEFDELENLLSDITGIDLKHDNDFEKTFS